MHVQERPYFLIFAVGIIRVTYVTDGLNILRELRICNDIMEMSVNLVLLIAFDFFQDYRLFPLLNLFLYWYENGRTVMRKSNMIHDTY